MNPRDVASEDAAMVAMRTELGEGLLRRPAEVSPKHLYDRLGSALFVAITELPEYDLARNEAAIFADHGTQIVDAVRARMGHGCTMVDLGAGDGAKAARLFPLLHPARYVAVDIAADFMASALQRLRQRYPAIEMHGVGTDFSRGLVLPEGLVDGPALVFYPGSSIGNFGPGAALALLCDTQRAAQGGALLIGVDLVKPAARLEAAYDDALGVTAAFNRNLLNHVNRQLGSDFDVRDWRHVATYDTCAARIEMHLEAVRALVVRWPGGDRRFDAGERILTEHSYKWTPAGFAALLRDAGYGEVSSWTDATGAYAVMLAAA